MKTRRNLVRNFRFLLETEVSHAEVMIASKEFAQEMQELIEKIGRLQNERLPPVTDQMREIFGSEASSAFHTQIYGALQGVMDSLYSAKGQIDDAVTNMAENDTYSISPDMDNDVEDTEYSDDEEAGRDMANKFKKGGGEDEFEQDLDNLASEFPSKKSHKKKPSRGFESDLGDDFGGAEFEEPLGHKLKESARIRNRKYR